MKKTIVLLLIMVNVSGCGSFGKKLRNFMKGNGWIEEATPAKPLSFSDTQNYRKGEQRKYVRMTKDQFEAEAKVGAQEGSLWVMEGQGSYLFSQNIVRLIGDLLTVKIEGAARTQVDTKINVIKKLLKKIDGQSRRLASEDVDIAANDKKDKPEKEEKKEEKKTGKDAGKDGKGKDSKETSSTAKSDGENSKEEESQYGVDVVPTRIVQRLQDGSYRVKGSQAFMIGKREFRVIVTGIIREQDFNDEGISSQALLEPIYDVVSVKKGI